MERFEIVVVGAHMSGMPLNGQLVQWGATFSRRITTSSDYRLYALAGGPPLRPGLLRVVRNEGAPIETEVWTLGVDGLGHLVASIPAPLSIGTVCLADGTAPKGFLVEAEGIKGAHDITNLGGWRAYLSQRTISA
jgi:allophanate hydrolase